MAQQVQMRSLVTSELAGGPVNNRANRVKALTDVTRALAEANIPYVVTDGAALGLVRNGTLEAHDDDIDIQVKVDGWDMIVGSLLGGSSGESILEELVPKHRLQVYKNWWYLKVQAADWGPLTFHLLRDVDPALVQEDYEADLLCSDTGLIPLSDLFPARFLNPGSLPGIKVAVPNRAEKRFVARYGYDWRIPKFHFKGTGWRLFGSKYANSTLESSLASQQTDKETQESLHWNLDHKKSEELFHRLCPEWHEPKH